MYVFFPTCFINVCYPNGTNENKMRKHCCLGPWLPYNLNNSLSLNWPITNQMSCPDIFTWMDSRSYKICPQVCYIWLYWKKNLVSRILVSFLMEKHLLLNKYTPILFYISCTNFNSAFKSRYMKPENVKSQGGRFNCIYRNI